MATTTFFLLVIMSTVGFHHLFANEIELFLNNVKVSKKVVVNPDKTGDYSTISDAVLAAPNNALVGDGYFVIHIVAGVYHEYISIPTHKKYLMMIGDGIGKTIITGNRSSSDGWGSSGSATFGNVIFSFGKSVLFSFFFSFLQGLSGFISETVIILPSWIMRIIF
ncbi:hypothetical protein JCGZ_23278 [Jatropha curcas]|uniref:Pectinesterase catalytic domain-containing protein n=1 Tax=Jatropha curcas TaxID=180498 RepID=A0A067JTW6_JATCU|nr:hypothetical protein JCGZ_23278 [Jatropha curcas]